MSVTSGQPHVHSPLLSSRRPCRGGVLIVTLWILVVLAAMMLVLVRTVRVQALVSQHQEASLQAEDIVQGAISWVVRVVQDMGDEFDDLSTDPWPKQVGEGFFWLLKPNLDDSRNASFGLIDAAAFLDLNSASLDMLMKLPEMTEELAQAIIDWRDPDENTSLGAESQYYLLQPQAYYAKNDRFESVEELLLVRGITRRILLGEDTNRNGLLDANEDDGELSDPPDNRDGKLDLGLIHYLGVHSVTRNVRSDGQPRVNVNTASPAQLANTLREYISSDRLAGLVDRIRSRRPFSSLLDLYYRAELTPEELDALADVLTTTNTRTQRGLVNIMTAPWQVLACLPGLEESDARAIVARRQSLNRRQPGLAWLTEVLSQEKAVAIGPLITTRSWRVIADIVAVDPRGRTFRRYQVVVDRRSTPPQVVFLRDLTALGWPLDPAILEDLRAGKGLAVTGRPGLAQRENRLRTEPLVAGRSAAMKDCL